METEIVLSYSTGLLRIFLYLIVGTFLLRRKNEFTYVLGIVFLGSSSAYCSLIVSDMIIRLIEGAG